LDLVIQALQQNGLVRYLTKPFVFGMEDASVRSQWEHPFFCKYMLQHWDAPISIFIPLKNTEIDIT